MRVKTVRPDVAEMKIFHFKFSYPKLFIEAAKLINRKMQTRNGVIWTIFGENELTQTPTTELNQYESM